MMDSKMDTEHKREMVKKKMKGLMAKKGKKGGDGHMMTEEEMKKKHDSMHK